MSLFAPPPFKPAESLLQLALLGVGIIRLSDAIVGAAIAEGRLVPLLKDVHHAEPLPLHAVYPQGRHRSPRVAAARARRRGRPCVPRRPTSRCRRAPPRTARSSPG